MATYIRYWLAPTGERFSELPGKWHNISPFTRDEAGKHGWMYLAERVPDQAPRTTCTKYELVRCLEAHYPALLVTLRAAYAVNTDLQFYWNTVVQLDRNNEDFKSAVSQLGITDEQLDEIFAKIEPVEV